MADAEENSDDDYNFEFDDFDAEQPKKLKESVNDLEPNVSEKSPSYQKNDDSPSQHVKKDKTRNNADDDDDDLYNMDEGWDDEPTNQTDNKPDSDALFNEVESNPETEVDVANDVSIMPSTEPKQEQEEEHQETPEADTNPDNADDDEDLYNLDEENDAPAADHSTVPNSLPPSTPPAPPAPRQREQPDSPPDSEHQSENVTTKDIAKNNSHVNLEGDVNTGNNKEDKDEDDEEEYYGDEDFEESPASQANSPAKPPPKKTPQAQASSESAEPAVEQAERVVEASTPTKTTTKSATVSTGEPAEIYAAAAIPATQETDVKVQANEEDGYMYEFDDDDEEGCGEKKNADKVDDNNNRDSHSVKLTESTKRDDTTPHAQQSVITPQEPSNNNNNNNNNNKPGIALQRENTMNDSFYINAILNSTIETHDDSEIVSPHYQKLVANFQSEKEPVLPPTKQEIYADSSVVTKAVLNTIQGRLLEAALASGSRSPDVPSARGVRVSKDVKSSPLSGTAKPVKKVSIGATITTGGGSSGSGNSGSGVNDSQKARSLSVLKEKIRKAREAAVINVEKSPTKGTAGGRSPQKLKSPMATAVQAQAPPFAKEKGSVVPNIKKARVPSQSVSTSNNNRAQSTKQPPHGADTDSANSNSRLPRNKKPRVPSRVATAPKPKSLKPVATTSRVSAQVAAASSRSAVPNVVPSASAASAATTAHGGSDVDDASSVGSRPAALATGSSPSRPLASDDVLKSVRQQIRETTGSSAVVSAPSVVEPPGVEAKRASNAKSNKKTTINANSNTGIDGTAPNVPVRRKNKASNATTDEDDTSVQREIKAKTRASEPAPSPTKRSKPGKAIAYTAVRIPLRDIQPIMSEIAAKSPHPDQNGSVSGGASGSGGMSASSSSKAHIRQVKQRKEAQLQGTEMSDDDLWNLLSPPGIEKQSQIITATSAVSVAAKKDTERKDTHSKQSLSPKKSSPKRKQTPSSSAKRSGGKDNKEENDSNTADDNEEEDDGDYGDESFDDDDDGDDDDDSDRKSKDRNDDSSLKKDVVTKPQTTPKKSPHKAPLSKHSVSGDDSYERDDDYSNASDGGDDSDASLEDAKRLALQKTVAGTATGAGAVKQHKQDDGVKKSKSVSGSKSANNKATEKPEYVLLDDIFKLDPEAAGGDGVGGGYEGVEEEPVESEYFSNAQQSSSNDSANNYYHNPNRSSPSKMQLRHEAGSKGVRFMPAENEVVPGKQYPEPKFFMPAGPKHPKQQRQKRSHLEPYKRQSNVLPPLHSQAPTNSNKPPAKQKAWNADPFHVYDSAAGLFSTFEDQALRESRKEQQRQNNLEKRRLKDLEIESARYSYIKRNQELLFETHRKNLKHIREDLYDRDDRIEALRAQHHAAQQKVAWELEDCRLKMEFLSKPSFGNYKRTASNP